MENLANRTHVEESELSEAMSSHRREKLLIGLLNGLSGLGCPWILVSPSS
jgi:hypothetical protein